MSSWRWIWSYLKPYRVILIISVVTFALENIVYVLSQTPQKMMIDDVFIGRHFEKLPLILLFFAAANLAWFALANLIIPYWGQKNSLTVNARLSRDLLDNLYKKPVATIQQQRTGIYVNYFTNDLKRVSDLLAVDIPGCVHQVTGMIVHMAIIGFINVKILLAVSFAGIIYVVLGRYFGPKTKQVSKLVQGKRAELVVELEESIASTREVAAYHRYDWQSLNYGRAYQTYFRQVMKEGKLVNLQLLATQPWRWLSNIFVLGYGGYEVLHGQLSLGVFVIIYQFSNELLFKFDSVFQFVMNLYEKLSSVERVQTVMTEEVIHEGEQTLEAPVRTLEFREVRFQYPGTSTNVLNGIDLQFPVGKKIGLVGPSGGGKSTVVQLLVRFFEYQGGMIAVNGMPLHEIRLADWIGRLTPVFQEPYLMPDTVRNNILLGRSGVSEERLQEICRLMMIHDDIEQLPDGYDTVIGERGITLSGGQRQRIALARAIIQDPEILILDEATSALDLQTERIIQANLDRLRQGKTTLIVAHRLSTIQNADLICVLRNGQVVESGTHDALMASDSFYRSLYEAKTLDEHQEVGSIVS